MNQTIELKQWRQLLFKLKKSHKLSQKKEDFNEQLFKRILAETHPPKVLWHRQLALVAASLAAVISVFLLLKSSSNQRVAANDATQELLELTRDNPQLLASLAAFNISEEDLLIRGIEFENQDQIEILFDEAVEE